MGNLIRLTESDLHKIIKESVKRILRENMYDNDIDIDYEFKKVMKIKDALERRLYTVLGDKSQSIFNIKIRPLTMRKNDLYIEISPKNEDYLQYIYDNDNKIEYKVERVIAKFGYYKNECGCFERGIYLIGQYDEDMLNKVPEMPKSMRSQNSYTNDGDNINLNDPNSGEAIRRKYAGSNEWSSSSAMENPFSSGSIYNLRRMYGGRRW